MKVQLQASLRGSHIRPVLQNRSPSLFLTALVSSATIGFVVGALSELFPPLGGSILFAMLWAATFGAVIGGILGTPLGFLILLLFWPNARSFTHIVALIMGGCLGAAASISFLALLHPSNNVDAEILIGGPFLGASAVAIIGGWIDRTI